MTRLQPLTPETMNIEQAELADWFKKTIGGDMLVTHRTWLRSTAFAPHIFHYAAYLRRKSMDFRKRELAILIVGRACQAPLEWHDHLGAAREAGIEEHIIDALSARKVPEFTREDDKIVYQFCVELLNTYRVSQDTFIQALDTFGDKIVVELVAITGLYVTLAMLIGAFDFDTPEGEPAPFPDDFRSRELLPLP
jgi:4-carboxymuconolactone decarboxylase